MPRCLVCRTRRASYKSLIKHIQDSGHIKPCTCGGYHYPHRPKSPYCYLNSLSSVRAAVREGSLKTQEEILDACLDLIF